MSEIAMLKKKIRKRSEPISSLMVPNPPLPHGFEDLVLRNIAGALLGLCRLTKEEENFRNGNNVVRMTQ